MPSRYLPTDPDLREALPIIEEFAASKGLRAFACDYHWGAERAEFGWRERGLGKGVSVERNRDGKGLTVEILVRGRAIPTAWVAPVPLILLVVAVDMAVGSKYVAPVALTALLAGVLFAQASRRFPGRQAPFYRFIVGVVPTPGEAARDSLRGLLMRGWTMLREFGPDDLRREYAAFRAFVDSRLLPVLRQTAADWGGRVEQVRPGPPEHWLVRWPGPHGPARLRVYVLPNDHVGVVAYAKEPPAAHLLSYRVDWATSPNSVAPSLKRARSRSWAHNTLTDRRWHSRERTLRPRTSLAPLHRLPGTIA